MVGGAGSKGRDLACGAGVEGGEKQERGREGELIVFDDSFEHEVWNESGETQIVLIVDFNHPDLPEKERKRQGHAALDTSKLRSQMTS